KTDGAKPDGAKTEVAASASSKAKTPAKPRFIRTSRPDAALRSQLICVAAIMPQAVGSGKPVAGGGSHAAEPPSTSIDLRHRHRNDFKQCYGSRSSRRSLIARQSPVPIGTLSVVPGNSGVASGTRVRTKLAASALPCCRCEHAEATVRRAMTGTLLRKTNEAI